MQALLLSSPVLPLVLALGLCVQRLRKPLLILAPVAALPALFLPAFSGLTVELPWLLLGTRLGIDQAGAVFLLLTGVLWIASGFFAFKYLEDDPERARFQFFFLLTYSGNLGVILALDTASFYLFFTLMTFAAYGVIVHDGSKESRRAGRVYLILAVIGEVLLLMGLLLIVGALGNPDLRELAPLLAMLPERDLIIGLILVGFGIKMGAVPLHVWLPLAHPCAPTPASAVLSGIIIKAGLLGWLRFLPLGESALPDWGALCLVIGIGSAFYAVLMGLFQARAKTVLAYSSISQMGLVTALLGVALGAPGAWPLLLVTLLFFSLHHGLAKAALFLGAGVTAGGARGSGWILALPALALVGAPLTSGFLAKLMLKDAAGVVPDDWVSWWPLMLSLSSVATGLLMGRFLYLAWPRPRGARVSVGLWGPWLGLVGASALLPWWWAHSHFPDVIAQALVPDRVIEALWILTAVGILTSIGWGIGRVAGFHWYLPEGDIIYLFSRLAQWLSSVVRTVIKLPGMGMKAMKSWRVEALLDRSEIGLGSLAGAAFLLLITVMVMLLADID